MSNLVLESPGASLSCPFALLVEGGTNSAWMGLEPRSPPSHCTMTDRICGMGFVGLPVVRVCARSHGRIMGG